MSSFLKYLFVVLAFSTSLLTAERFSLSSQIPPLMRFDINEEPHSSVYTFRVLREETFGLEGQEFISRSLNLADVKCNRPVELWVKILSWKNLRTGVVRSETVGWERFKLSLLASQNVNVEPLFSGPGYPVVTSSDQKLLSMGETSAEGHLRGARNGAALFDVRLYFDEGFGEFFDGYEITIAFSYRSP